MVGAGSRSDTRGPGRVHGWGGDLSKPGRGGQPVRRSPAAPPGNWAAGSWCPQNRQRQTRERLDITDSYPDGHTWASRRYTWKGVLHTPQLQHTQRAGQGLARRRCGEDKRRWQVPGSSRSNLQLTLQRRL